MQHGRLLDREERLARQHETVPEREPPVLRRFPDGLAPRDLLMHDVAEGGVLRDLRSDPRSVGPEWRRLVSDIDRTVDARRHERLADEEKRAQREQQRDTKSDCRNEAMSEPEAESGRPEIHGEQAKNEQQHADSVYPEGRSARRAGVAAASSPRANAATP